MSIAEHFERADAYCNEGNYDCAIDEYDEIIKLDPNEGTVKFYRTRAYSLKRADEYCNEGNYDSAIDKYNELIRWNPYDATAHFYRARAYSNKCGYHKAHADSTRMIPTEPNNVKKYFYDCAMEEYDEIIREDPNNAKAIFYRAMVIFYRAFPRGNIDDYYKALAECDRASQLEPNADMCRFRADMYYFCSAVHEHMCEYKRAFYDLDQAIQLDPGSAKSYIARGNLYLYGGGYKCAIEDFEAALRIDPNNFLAKRGLEETLEKRIKDPDPVNWMDC